jgi:hypothetical protein
MRDLTGNQVQVIMRSRNCDETRCGCESAAGRRQRAYRWRAVCCRYRAAMNPMVEAAWIAGGSGFLAVLVGVTGTVVVAMRGYRSTQRATQQSIAAGAVNVQAQIQADRQEQRRDRLHETYSALGMYLSRQADWARSVAPLWGPGTPVESPPRDGLWRVETLVTLYGSPEVQRLLTEWTEHARKVESAGDTISRLKKAANPSLDFSNQAHEEQTALPGYKAAMASADEALRAQMNRELAAS